MITTFDLVYWGTTIFLLGLLIVGGWACLLYIFATPDEPAEPEAEEPPSAFVVAIDDHLASRKRVP